MTRIIDRRANYNKNKNVSNRQRFIERVKGQIKDNINLNIQKGKLSDLAKGDKINVKVRNTKEPTFSQDSETGTNDIAIPGNVDFIKGDTIAKPPKGGSRSRKASQGEDSSDDITFTLTKDEFYDLLFEDLELPDLIKKDIKGADTFTPERRGFTTTGNPSNLDIIRSSKNSLGRRIALKRPSKKKLAQLENLLKLLLGNPVIGDHSDRQKRIAELQEQITKAKRKQKSIPYFDPIDVRYRRFDKTPKPITNAVMFCLMDVSGSMGEREKDIAKRFFLLLYMFLHRKYERVEIVFIRHTTTAQEVDEQTFFYDPISGGTQISTGLELIDKIIGERYDLEKTNIYVSQASDGENYESDNNDCFRIINNSLIKKIQYFAYIEILDERIQERLRFPMDSEELKLWEIYVKLEQTYKHFKARQIFNKSEIFEVFRALFSKKADKAHG